MFPQENTSALTAKKEKKKWTSRPENERFCFQNISNHGKYFHTIEFDKAMDIKLFNLKYFQNVGIAQHTNNCFTRYTNADQN